MDPSTPGPATPFFYALIKHLNKFFAARLPLTRGVRIGATVARTRAGRAKGPLPRLRQGSIFCRLRCFSRPGGGGGRGWIRQVDLFGVLPWNSAQVVVDLGAAPIELRPWSQFARDQLRESAIRIDPADIISIRGRPSPHALRPEAHLFRSLPPAARAAPGRPNSDSALFSQSTKARGTWPPCPEELEAADLALPAF